MSNLISTVYNKKIHIVVIFFAILMAILITFKILSVTDKTELQAEQEKIIFSQIDQSNFADIKKFAIYGTHFNVEGTLNIVKLSGISINNVSIVIKKYDNTETPINSTFSYADNIITFTSSDKINDGINLEDISEGNYFLFLKIAYSNSETKYYSLKNSSSYGDIEYYTITKNQKNNKININFNTYNNIPYMKLSSIEVDELPEDIYDIAIDPGHGGKDTGATSNGYNESDLVLKAGLSLKEKLENLGLKVFISRDGTESSTEDTENNMYDSDGRVNILNKSHAKIILSLHLNSNKYSKTSGGVEIYAPNDCNLDFASLLAKNIVDTCNTYYSKLNLYKKSDGVYVHNFTQTDIQSFNAKASSGKYEPYNITTSTPFLYLIRETGGISTNAFVDGRNTKYGKNQYWNSNLGSETYELDLAYMYVKNDLDNFVNNYENYVKAISDSIKNYYLK